MCIKITEKKKTLIHHIQYFNVAVFCKSYYALNTKNIFLHDISKHKESGYENLKIKSRLNHI